MVHVHVCTIQIKTLPSPSPSPPLPPLSPIAESKVNQTSDKLSTSESHIVKHSDSSPITGRRAFS